ncbi:MAG: UPF0182 family protein [Clostridiales Family XIII bacterium]|jgi:uncharacterized membrane protein (UPF0182 family)|nr:UPF0182 family protein [Clostridiales Family XIII bacterium]
MNEKRKRVVAGVVIACIVIIIALAALSGFITDIFWFNDLGYISVFLKKLLTQLAIGVPVFLILFLVGTLYLNAINKGYHKRLIISEERLGAKGQKRLSLAFSAFASLIITYTAVTTVWYTFLQFRNSTDFGIADPIFGFDVSFYTFRLQFIHGLNNTVITGIVVYAFMTFIYYAILMSVAPPKAIPQAEESDDELGKRRKQTQQRSAFTENLMRAFGIDPELINPQGAQPRQDGSGGHFRELIYIASKQIIVLGILFFLMLGVNFFLRQFDLLYTSTDVLYGAGYMDIHITLWVYRILIVLAVIAAIMFARGVAVKKVKTTFAVPVVMICVGIVGAIVGAVMQNLVVSPDAINKEGPYLAYNIEFTQNAYDLGDVSIRDFPADNQLTGADIESNSETIKNIRINDYDPAKIFYNSTQSIRQYYNFNDVDVDRYMINGEYTQTFLTAREIDETKIPNQWLNLHLKYTHGYGIALSRVDKVTASGQPDMLIKNIPPESQVDEIEITRPEIYFGELTNNAIVVGTDEQEFDYPDGESNVQTMYEADSGVKMNLFNRIMFSIREGDIKLLFSSNINSESRIIINRNIAQRVREIMGDLQYSDPYMVTANGNLYWIIDAYTTSKNYPYSEPYNFSAGDTTNYIRNSVKVVIDAYTGDTGYYLVDEADPVAATMSKIYPQLFRTIDQMPGGVAQHIRYPSTMLNIQANVYKRYHMTNISVFYQGEDRWDIAKEKVGASDDETAMQPNYYIMKLPGEQDVEFINSIPYTPKDKNNMTALLVARNDGEHYGELILYQLPKGKIVMGPSQIDAQIAQDTTISQDFALWQNSGSEYRRGNLFVIPIENSIMYVEPIYLQANEGSMPEVKKIIVYYNDKIAYENTLAEALDAMFGAGVGDGSATLPGGEDADQEGDGSGTPGGEGTSPGGAGTSPGGSDAGAAEIDGLSQAELIAGAQAAFDKGQRALKDGDWAAYGEAQKELGEYLSKLAGDTGTGARPAPALAEEEAADGGAAASEAEAASAA